LSVSKFGAASLAKSFAANGAEKFSALFAVRQLGLHVSFLFYHFQSPSKQFTKRQKFCKEFLIFKLK